MLLIRHMPLDPQSLQGRTVSNRHLASCLGTGLIVSTAVGASLTAIGRVPCCAMSGAVQHKGHRKVKTDLSVGGCIVASFQMRASCIMAVDAAAATDVLAFVHPQSLFTGKRSPLVEDGNPLLYPRYTHVSEILAVSCAC